MSWFKRKKEPEENKISAQSLTCPGCPRPCPERGPRGKMGPPQSGKSGTVLIFDRNAVINGSSISHAQNSGTFTIQQTGFYQVSFHGTLAPASGSAFPLTVSLYLQQQGTGYFYGPSLCPSINWDHRRMAVTVDDIQEAKIREAVPGNPGPRFR